MANEYLGWQRYLHIAAAESTWGTINGTPAWRQCPYAEYTVRAQHLRRQSTPTTGSRARRHNQAYGIRVAGNLTTNLYGKQVSNISLAELLVAWAWNAPSSNTLESRTIEVFESLAARRHLGLRVNSCTIAGSVGTPITISLELIGQAETNTAAGSAQALSATDVPERSEFLFEEATFSLGGSALPMESFSLSLNNNLSERSLNSTSPSLLLAGQRVVDFNVVVPHNATTRDGYRRAITQVDTTAQLVLKGLHDGSGSSGTYSQVTIDFDKVSFGDKDNQGDQNSIVNESQQWIVLKPSTSDNDVDFTWANS